METSKEEKSGVIIRLFRILICAGVLAGGLLGMFFLAGLKVPPTEQTPKEKPRRVEVLTVEPENVQVWITTHGEVTALNQLTISPQVSGKIVHIHPGLEVGALVKAQDVLLRIDPQTYRAAHDEARATVMRLKATIKRLGIEQSCDRKRLKILKRNKALTLTELERSQRLLKLHKVGNQSAVDRKEQAYNSVADMADQLAATVEMLPLRIREASSNLVAAQAQLNLAGIHLSRCTLKAPFSGRVKAVFAEQHQHVAAGEPVLTLVDDSVLEIPVPIDSRDAAKWLRFKGNPDQTAAGWFQELEKVSCRVRWSEGPANHFRPGRIDRIMKFDPDTRTLFLAVRIVDPPSRQKVSVRLPLVEGMFCEVKIPGRILSNVIRLPGHAVSFDHTVYIARHNRLQTVDVKTVRIQEEQALISAGLKPGDQVIVTPLVDPIENMLLEVIPAGTAASIARKEAS